MAGNAGQGIALAISIFMLLQIYSALIHCKYFSRNISGFYACPIISCTIFVLITALGCAQLSDVMNLINCTLFVSIATNRC